MVALLLLTLAQTPGAPAQPPAPPPKTTVPAKPPAKPRATTGATTTAQLFITDSSGAPIEGVTVNVMGPVDREVQSAASGPTRIPGLRAGTYRVRFAREGFITDRKSTRLNS